MSVRNGVVKRIRGAYFKLLVAQFDAKQAFKGATAEEIKRGKLEALEDERAWLLKLDEALEGDPTP